MTAAAPSSGVGIGGGGAQRPGGGGGAQRRGGGLTTKPCWKTTTRGGVGVLIGSVLLLALIGTTQWNHVDADVSTYIP